MDKQQFLMTYNISEKELAEANISWEELAQIMDEYRGIEGKLRDLGKSFIDEYLYDIEKAGIHSYRYRTKAPDHLLEKIIRKRREAPETYDGLDHTNYYKFVTDLIGIRVLFLYREDWEHFHKRVRRDCSKGYELIHVRTYNRNLSVDRLISHHYFAQEVTRRLEEIKPKMI